MRPGGAGDLGHRRRAAHSGRSASPAGLLHADDLTTPPPIERWAVQLPGNIESTPAIWKGRTYVGSRDGYFHAIGDG